MPKPAVVMVCDISLERIEAPMVHVTSVARAFAQEGYEIDLVARGPDPHLSGVRYHRAGSDPSGRLQRIVGVNATAARVLVARRRRARGLYIREDWTVTPTFLVGRALGYTIVPEVNDVRYGPESTFVVAGLRGRVMSLVKGGAARVSFACSTRILAITDGLAGVLNRTHHLPDGKVFVQMNGVDLDEITPLDRAAAIERLGLKPDRRYVVFVGAVQPWVDWETMVGAVAEVAKTRPDVSLVVVGDLYETPVGALAASLGIESRVILAGFVGERERVNDYIGAASVCLVSLRDEHRGKTGSSPMKLTEYMAAGRPIVGTALEGMRQVMEESGSGTPVPAADVPATARAIADLLDDPGRAEAMGRAGRAAAEQHHSWRAIARRVGGVLAEGTR